MYLFSYTLDRILYGYMYLRACSDGSVNQYTMTYILTLPHAFTHSRFQMPSPNEQVNDHFYGIILHYHMYGGGYYMYYIMVRWASIKFTASQGPHVGLIRP